MTPKQHAYFILKNYNEKYLKSFRSRDGHYIIGEELIATVAFKATLAEVECHITEMQGKHELKHWEKIKDEIKFYER